MEYLQEAGGSRVKKARGTSADKYLNSKAESTTRKHLGAFSHCKRLQIECFTSSRTARGLIPSYPQHPARHTPVPNPEARVNICTQHMGWHERLLCTQHTGWHDLFTLHLGIAWILYPLRVLLTHTSFLYF